MPSNCEVFMRNNWKIFVYPIVVKVVARSHVHAGGRGWGTLKDGFRGGDYMAKADQAADLTGTY